MPDEGLDKAQDMNHSSRHWNIEELIPHRGRMKLIDDVLEISDEGAITSARVSDRWPLYRDSSVDSLVLIEIVAQTAAVHISGRIHGGRNATDRRGWLVGIKNADFFRDRIPIETVLTTTVKRVSSIDQYSVLEGEVYAGTNLIGCVRIQVLREGSDERTS